MGTTHLTPLPEGDQRSGGEQPAVEEDQDGPGGSGSREPRREKSEEGVSPLPPHRREVVTFGHRTKGEFYR